MGKNAAAIGGVDRHEHGAEIGHRIKGQQDILSVRQPHHNLIAFGHAQSLQAGRLGQHAAAHLGIAPLAAILERDINSVRLDGCPAVDQIARDTTVAIGNAAIKKVTLFRARRHSDGFLPLFLITGQTSKKRAPRKAVAEPYTDRYVFPSPRRQTDHQPGWSGTWRRV